MSAWRWSGLKPDSSGIKPKALEMACLRSEHVHPQSTLFFPGIKDMRGVFFLLRDVSLAGCE